MGIARAVAEDRAHKRLHTRELRAQRVLVAKPSNVIETQPLLSGEVDPQRSAQIHGSANPKLAGDGLPDVADVHARGSSSAMSVNSQVP